jgi:hypothetical protein
MKLVQAALKIAKENPEFRRKLVAALKEARFTIPPIKVKYTNLGDFGGTNRVYDSWILEVGGSSFRIKDELKRLGFKWVPNSKVWRIEAVDYGGRSTAVFEKMRALQEKAYKVVKPLVEIENKKIEEANKQTRVDIQGEKTLRERMKDMLSSERRLGFLRKLGVEPEIKFPQKYSLASDEPMLVLKGNTFRFREVFQGFGFKWDGANKAWILPYAEYSLFEGNFLKQMAMEAKK